MKSFQQKRGFKNVLHSKPVLVLLSIVLLFSIYSLISFMGKMQVTRENRKIVESKVEQLEKEKERLSLDIAKLKTEGGIEESVREKFGLAKEGEGVIVIIEDKNKSEPPKKESKGFFSFFWNWFQ